ncbi:DotI/IcmL family type IV secretion protein [Tahibacter amnicola]|uniref:DotI/IcmL family type IV secretion protein n=1 Tax=Tahibacter amnicola TaxID=2976241 RepID=A0ABY6BKL1_9GAMM|nr:DotI/IcmL family type IV secretion protein [Tahibacter amnicola]UXI68337.1 DotI/IcmL family type IV secretion protein [Tahibacter amnicola]
MSSNDTETPATADAPDEGILIESGEGAAVLREVHRLHEDNRTLKRTNLRVWAAVGTLAALNAVTIAGGIWLFPKYRYIATTDATAVCEITPDSEPRVTPATIADFAKDTVLESNTYDYVNYRESINRVASSRYTENGRAQYLASLDQSGNLERVIKGRYILRAMATKVPQIEQEGRRGAQRFWIVAVPIAIEFYSGSERDTKVRKDFLAQVTVVQVAPSALNVKGIATESTVLSANLSGS